MKKGFKDLKFKNHNVIEGGMYAFLNFDNGEWISVIVGGVGFCGDGVSSFEIMSSSTNKKNQK